eukprot:7930171-Pyramimonas_sp.AAC.1
MVWRRTQPYAVLNTAVGVIVFGESSYGPRSDLLMRKKRANFAIVTFDGTPKVQQNAVLFGGEACKLCHWGLWWNSSWATES